MPGSVKRTLIGIPTRTNWQGLRALGDALWAEGYGQEIVVYDHGHRTPQAQETLGGFTSVIFAEHWPFYRMWNAAWQLAGERKCDAVTLLNDDVTLAAGAIAEALRVMGTDSRIGIVGFNYMRSAAEGTISPGGIRDVYGAFRKGGLPGWAFMLRSSLWGEIPPIDENYNIWFGDDDLFQTVHAAGYRTVIAEGAPVDHATSSTFRKFSDLLAKTPLDSQRFMRRWGSL